MGPEGGEGRLPVEFRSVVFEAFLLDTSKIFNNWSLIFRKSYGEGKSIVKLFLTFCKSLFTRVSHDSP